MTLAEFLLARIAEDEAVARMVVDGTEQNRFHSWVSVDFGSSLTADHGNRWSPDRVLAECEAKRRIVARFRETGPPFGDAEQEIEHDQLWLWVLPCLALPYATHPDYLTAWRQ